MKLRAWPAWKRIFPYTTIIIHDVESAQVDHILLMLYFVKAFTPSDADLNSAELAP